VGPDKPNVYTPLTSSANGYTILPPGYGIKMFELGGRGELLPVAVEKNKEKVNLVAYGVMPSPGVINVTLINREYGPEGRGAEVTVDLGRGVGSGRVVKMEQESGEVSAVGGVRVGGRSFTEDGKWSGDWSALKEKTKGNELRILVGPSTALVLQVTLK
jgi:hypothetical protein